jgi:hypothetical protein
VSRAACQPAACVALLLEQKYAATDECGFWGACMRISPHPPCLDKVPAGYHSPSPQWQPHLTLLLLLLSAGQALPGSTPSKQLGCKPSLRGVGAAGTGQGYDKNRRSHLRMDGGTSREWRANACEYHVITTNLNMLLLVNNGQSGRWLTQLLSLASCSRMACRNKTL